MIFLVAVISIALLGLLTRIPAVKRSTPLLAAAHVVVGLLLAIGLALPLPSYVVTWPIIVAGWVSLGWSFAVQLTYGQFLQVLGTRGDTHGVPEERVLLLLPRVIVIWPASALAVPLTVYLFALDMESKSRGVIELPSLRPTVLITAVLSGLLLLVLAIATAVARRRNPWYRVQMGLTAAALRRGEAKRRVLEDLATQAGRV